MKSHRPAGPNSKSLDWDSSQNIPAVFLKSPIRQALVYRKRVKQVDPSAKSGDLVAVYADFQETERSPSETRLLGYALYNKKAEICLRMLTFGDELPTPAAWEKRLAEAVTFRTDFLKLPQSTNAYRVIHAESDGLSGLVVDQYGPVLSAEVFSLGMFQRAEAILERLRSLTNSPHFVVRPAPHTLAQEGFVGESFRSPNCPTHTEITEFGTRFKISFDDAGHKTGFFCDQRDNRKLVADHCRDKTVLDLCCYTGGFSVQAKKLGGAKDVLGVDLDQSPLRIAKENAHLNQCAVRFVNADIFPFMRDMIRNERKFDVVILDPPKLIRSRNEFDEGLRAHYDMNRLAMRLVNPGGLLLTCTCAGLLPRAQFLEMLTRAARPASGIADPSDPVQQAMRLELSGKILAQTGAGADHPVALNALETEYLQGVLIQIS